MLKVGMLTSGGDCQSLNATMRGVAKSLYRLYRKDVEIIGFIDGYKGLIHEKYKIMQESDFSGILTRGGTIIGTSREAFKRIREIEEDGIDKVEAMKNTYSRLGLDCLVVLGGNGSQKTANLLCQEGLNVIGLPKTIDNDLFGTEMTFGFHSALEVATKAIDNIHTTAASHGRVFIVELMGNKVGWLTLYAGLAGGADIILMPEIPYDINLVANAIKIREENYKKFSILAVAEGDMSIEDVRLTKKELRIKRKLSNHPSVAYEIGDKIFGLTGHEIRVTVPGHMQRGGEPSAYDRVLSTRLGAKAAVMLHNKEFGKMVAIQGEKIVAVELSDIAAKIKQVDPKSDIIKEARLVGISFGDA